MARLAQSRVTRAGSVSEVGEELRVEDGVSLLLVVDGEVRRAVVEDRDEEDDCDPDGRLLAGQFSRVRRHLHVRHRGRVASRRCVAS